MVAVLGRHDLCQETCARHALLDGAWRKIRNRNSCLFVIRTHKPGPDILHDLEGSRHVVQLLRDILTDLDPSLAAAGADRIFGTRRDLDPSALQILRETWSPTRPLLLPADAFVFLVRGFVDVQWSRRGRFALHKREEALTLEALALSSVTVLELILQTLDERVALESQVCDFGS